MSIERAQLGDIELMTLFPAQTQGDTRAELRFMNFLLPDEDVKEILEVIAKGVIQE